MLELQDKEAAKKEDDEAKAIEQKESVARKLEKRQEQHAAIKDRKFEKKEQLRDLFFDWIETKPIQTLINEKYKKGLYVKYLMAIKAGNSTSGVNKDGWIAFLKQSGVFSMVDPKALIKIHNSTMKDVQDLPMEDYLDLIEGSSKQSEVKPKGGELHYGGFVSALIKIANMRHIIKEEEGKPVSKQKIDDYAEYNCVDKTGKAFETFLEYLKVGGAKS